MPSQPAPPINEPLTNDVYKVHSVKASGKSSQILGLIDYNGEVTTAYIQASDMAIKAGINISNVTIESKDSSYGKYNLLSAYQVHAAA